jgi:hypothetical protein
MPVAISNNRKPISRDIAWLIVILVSFGAGIALHRFVFGVVNVQALNMEIAGEELPKARTMLEKNVRFKDVTPFVYTGQGGALGLHGSVEKDEDLFELMKAVAAERFQVTVHWNVKVLQGQADD